MTDVRWRGVKRKSQVSGLCHEREFGAINSNEKKRWEAGFGVKMSYILNVLIMRCLWNRPTKIVTLKEIECRSLIQRGFWTGNEDVKIIRSSARVRGREGERERKRERDWGGAGKEEGKLREGERIFLERILQRFLCESSKTEKLEIKTCQVGAKKLSPYSTFDPTAVPDFNQISVMWFACMHDWMKKEV